MSGRAAAAWMITRIRPANPRRSASMRWPTHSFALHSPGSGRQPPYGPSASSSATTVAPDAASRSAMVAWERSGSRSGASPVRSVTSAASAPGDPAAATSAPTSAGGVATPTISAGVRVGRTGSSRPPSASQHAADCPPPTSNSGGSSVVQRSNASGQRGWNRQPVGIRERVGRLADEDRPRAARRRSGGSGVGDTETSAAVYGWWALADDLVGRADLDDPAQVHHRDPVGDHPGERQVVGDEQVGQPALLAQVEHQSQQLGPDRDVEHRDRLVGDHQLRAHREGAGDDHALALAAGQLVRVAEREARRQPGRLERGRDARLAVGQPGREPVDLESARRRSRGWSASGSASRTGPGR